MLSLPVAYLSAQSGPIEISNDGEINVDQSGERVSIETNVEVHQSPFFLNADKVIWKKGTDQLLVSGNVFLFLNPSETDDASIDPFLMGSNDSRSLDRVEILHTDELRFNVATKTITTTGPANIQFGLTRIIGNELKLNLENKKAEAGSYRVGFGDLFLKGDQLSAEQDKLIADNAHFFIGEPETFSIQGRAARVEKEGEDTVILKGVRLQLGPLPFFYWPYFKYHLKRPVYSVSGGAGYSGDIGAYVELRPTYEPTEHLKVFTDFNFYSERGVLIGPGYNISGASKSGHHYFSKLETGYIRDNGNLGQDIIGVPIDGERHFVDFELLDRYKDTFQILSRIERWSDSEILRDFTMGKFRSIQQPQSFVELNQLWGPLGVTFSSHFRHEAFEYAIERTPELEIRLLPTALFKTGLYHTAEVAGVKLRNSDPDQVVDLQQNRFRAYYGLLYPVSLKSWLDFTPQATFQQLTYTDSGADKSSFDFTHLELGFDLTAHIYGEWKLENKVWNINGIRHLMNPTLQFRHINKYGEDNQSPLPIEAEIFRTGVEDIDLTANTHLDDLESYSLLRVGIINSVVARKGDGITRELMGFDLFHDLYHPDASAESDRSMLAANIKLKPANWINLSLQGRMDTNAMDLNDLFARLRLIDGDIWDLDLATQFVRDNLQQYVVDFRYKVFENVRFVSALGFDARRSLFYEQTYGFEFGIANYWDIFASINLREGSTRNNETRFELKVQTARF